MPGPGGDIALRLDRPRRAGAPGPVGGFDHGGGFVVGSIDTHADIASEIRRASSTCPAVSVDNCSAPDTSGPPRPTMLRPQRAGSPKRRDLRSRIPTSAPGDSAGGNLTLIVTAVLRDEPAASPLAQIGIHRVFDRARAMNLTPPSATARGSKWPTREYYEWLISRTTSISAARHPAQPHRPAADAAGDRGARSAARPGTRLCRGGGAGGRARDLPRVPGVRSTASAATARWSLRRKPIRSRSSRWLRR